MFGPSSRQMERAVAVERESFKESFDFTTLYLDDELSFDIDVPSGGRVAFEGWRQPPEKAVLDFVAVRLVVSRRGGRGRTISTVDLGAAEGGWHGLGQFHNDGPEAGFRFSLSSVPAGTGPLAWLRALLPPAMLRPWADIEKTNALLIRRPTVVGPAESQVPNVIYISVDMLRADHLGLHGYHRQTTPNLDRFADESVVFDRAFSTDTWTLPSHMTALSSLYTSVHQINDPGNEVTKIAFPTLQRVLGQRHFATAALTDGGAVSAHYGFDIGFDDFYEEVGVFHNPGMSGMSRRTFAKVEEWLDGHADRPLFLFVHTHEAHHFPNTIPEQVEVFSDPIYDGFFSVDEGEDRNFVDRIHQAEKDDTLVDDRDVSYAVDLYDGGIRVADAEIGRFLDRLRKRGLYDEALIIIASDHGESFRNFHDSGRVRQWYHFRPPYIEQIRIPLIVKFPNRMNLTGVCDADVSLLDLAPTVLDVVGAPAPSSFQGLSLLPLLRGEGPSVGHPVVAERVPPVRKGKGELWVTVIDGDRKIIQRRAVGGAELPTQYYDLGRDPLERCNLADDPHWRPETWSDLVAVATAHFESVQGLFQPSAEPPTQPVDEKHLEELKALGYVR